MTEDNEKLDSILEKIKFFGSCEKCGLVFDCRMFDNFENKHYDDEFFPWICPSCKNNNHLVLK